MGTLRQLSFSSGELAPAVYSRVDTTKYQAGLRVCRNWIVQRQGGVANRPGTSLIGEVKNSANFTRLIPAFISSDNNYVLEFGDLYMRVIQNGQYVMALGVPYEIVTPYTAAEIPTLDFGRAQKANVFTLCHQSHKPAELTCAAADDWTLADIVFGSATAKPTGLTTTGTPDDGYFHFSGIMTSGSGFFPTGSAVSGSHYNFAPNTIPAVAVPTAFTFVNAVLADSSGVHTTTVSCSGTVYPTGRIEGTFDGGPSIQGTFVGNRDFQAYAITSVDATTGEETEPAIIPSLKAFVGDFFPLPPVTLNWLPVVGSGKYRVYALITSSVPARYGLLGEVATGTTFTDVGLSPSGVSLAPTPRNPFDAAGDWPAISGIYQQRRWFANTLNNPEHIYGSQIGRMSNFNISAPLRADDAVDFGVVGRQANRIKHLLDLRAFFIFTDTGEYAIQGGLIAPDSVDIKQHSYNGSSDLQPIVVGNLPMFIQRAGNVARNVLYDFYTQSFKCDDQSIFASHLFEGHTITELAYAKIPNSVMWAVRDDGALLGFTYIPEHEIAAWHRHDTKGTFESICTVPEQTAFKFRLEDVLYAVVKRTINGVTKRFVEKFETRLITDVKDCVFMDCAVSYDGRGVAIAPGIGNTLQLTTITSGWTPSDDLLLSSYFPTNWTAAMIGQCVFFTAADGRRIQCVVTGFTSANILTVRPEQDVPVELQGAFVQSTGWAYGLKTLDGLDHLEGEDVSVLGDGTVEASPNNSDIKTKVTVTGGVATFSTWYSVIHVGLPYLSDMETLDMDYVQGETMMGKKKIVESLAMQVEKTRGLFFGPQPPTGTDALAGLLDPKLRDEEDYDVPTDLLTGVIEKSIQSRWNNNGRVFVRQVDPIPATILSIAPTGFIPQAG